MKIIITYASAGAGHLKAAEAIYSYLKEHHKEVDVQIIDVLSKANVLFRLSYKYTYLLMVKHALLLWHWGFRITHNRPLRIFTREISSLTNRVNTKDFAKFLIEEKADFIISTHFLPSKIAASLRMNRKINSKLVTVITDFGVHRFWIAKGTDIYVVASTFTKQQLISEGIAEESIKVIGIPLDAKFGLKYEKGSLLKKNNLKQNKFTVLITTGSFGIGPIEEIVDLLHNNAQIIVICACNKRLFKRLKDKNYPSVLTLGFVNNTQELMAVSDIIITKPGGLTISEALAMELVPVFIHPIPGQETENAKILERYGVSLCIERTEDVREVILDYKYHPEKLNKIREKIREIKKPFASQELYNVIR